MVVRGIGAHGQDALAIGREGGRGVAPTPPNAGEPAGFQVQHLQLGGNALAPARVLLELRPHGLAAVYRQHFGQVELAGREHLLLPAVAAQQHELRDVVEAGFQGQYRAIGDVLRVLVLRKYPL